jgi:hypothetical protein
MLNSIDTVVPTIPHQDPFRPAVKPIKIIRAHSLAHIEMGAGDRIVCANDWVKGRSFVIPTVKLAAFVFGVSERHVTCVPKDLRRHSSLPLGMLTYGWLKSSEAERAAFCNEYETQVWAALEHVTDGQYEFPVTICPNRNK